MSQDTHVSLTCCFPPGKQDVAEKFYKGAKTANKSIYYGFATNGDKLMCRQGYKNAEDFFAYMKEVGCCYSGDGVNIVISGPKKEIDKIELKMTEKFEAKITCAELDGNNVVLGRLPESAPDTHVTILPEFRVPEGRMQDFRAGFEKFYSATRAGTKDCLYYGFAVAGDKVRGNILHLMEELFIERKI